MSTQLRLVEAPEEPAPPRRRRVQAARRGRQLQPARHGRRGVRWPDWRLDDRARRVGREGVAQARAALAQSQRPERSAALSKAS